MSSLKRAAKKIQERAAFTLAEALVAVIILLLVSSIVAAGIPSAVRAYDNVVVASNAEVLLSTTMSALRNELSTAKEITIADDGTTITYYNQAVDAKSKLYIPDSDEPKDIMYQRYISTSDSDTRFMSEEASDTKMKLHVSYDSAIYSGGIVTFTGLKVQRIKSGNIITAAEIGTYSIRVITDSHY